MRLFPANTDVIWKQSVLRKHGIAALLALAFLLMCFLSLQQNRTIASQRELINSLLHDSLELNAIQIQQVQAARRR